MVTYNAGAGLICHFLEKLRFVDLEHQELEDSREARTSKTHPAYKKKTLCVTGIG